MVTSNMGIPSLFQKVIYNDLNRGWNVFHPLSLYHGNRITPLSIDRSNTYFPIPSIIYENLKR